MRGCIAVQVLEGDERTRSLSCAAHEAHQEIDDDVKGSAAPPLGGARHSLKTGRRRLLRGRQLACVGGCVQSVLK
eukprot:2872996-Alexandrium_andersonii.AAC.1